MAIKVKNIQIKLQSGTDNTYYATWDPPVSTVTTTTTSGSVKKGSLVSIKSGATYYNGVKVPSWVREQKWYVHSVSGNRAIINKNEAGTNSIMSPIHTKYLSGGSSSSSSSTTTTTKVSNLDHYKIIWKYATGDGVAWIGSETTCDTNTTVNALYSPPEHATKVQINVKPVSKTYTSNNKEKSYWTGSWAYLSLPISEFPPPKPSAPTVEIDKYTLTASIVLNADDEDQARTDQIQFEVYNRNTNKKVNSGTATVQLARAEFTCNVEAGSEYVVRCRAVNTASGTSYSDWSDYSSIVETVPASVTNVVCSAESKTSIKVTWDAVPTATSYDVQYTNNKLYFDTSSSVSSMTVESNTAYLLNLQTGYTWYVRVRAKNDKNEESGWSDISSAIVGTKPEPPTTWSLSTTASVGEDVILYWTHNSEDGSKQTEAQISLTVNGSTEYITVQSSVSEDEDEPVYSYTVNTADYSDGGDILWMVKTKGVHDDYSDWSTQRIVNIFAPPTLELTPNFTDDILTSLPIEFTTIAGPSNQTPISYYISVVAADAYETVDNVGNTVLITAGSEVYSKVVVSSESTFTHSISAGDITLEAGQTYTLSVMVSMDSGLTVTALDVFTVDWETKDYIADASIVIDRDTLSAYISPFCLGEEDVLIEGVTLSVYRRESDGSFTEIGTGLENNMVTTVTDPHPSLDYARYRIVVTDTNTGAVDYSDLPGEPIGEPSIVIQWDEQWTSFDYEEVASPDIPPWTGSMLRLPYNVDISEKNDIDVSLVEYIGRKHPVSYYGTQQGEGGSWSTEVDKTDKETIYALRRLKAWMGDVYVRAPSGIGYWAQISVSMSEKHRELTVPVNFTINRVEGGM